MQDSLEGQQLGPFRVEARLGSGGMATVYRATTYDHRTIALKVLQPYLASNETFRARFAREAQAIRALDHANIVKVLEAGEIDGYSFIAMEYVPGGTLKDRLEQGALSLNDAAQLLGQIAAGLQYAHDHGVVHRDVKPSNILLAGGRFAKLSDFGLAKLLNESSADLSLTRTGGYLGTARYMAPEQIEDPSRVDERADIYALGILLFEMLSGSTPYDSDTPQNLMYKHIHHPIPSLRQIAPTMPEVLDRVMFKALAKTPDARFESVTELAEVVNDIVMGREPSVALPELRAETDVTLMDSSDFSAGNNHGRRLAPDESMADLSTLLESMSPMQRALFEDALEAYDRHDFEEARQLLMTLLDRDDRVAPAWVLRSYVETNWYDQMRCAENAVAVAPDLVDAQLRVQKLKAERLPATFGRTYSTIPAVREVREQAVKNYFAESRLEDEDDPLNDPYQCPYCGVPNDPDRRKCAKCGRSLMRRVPPDEQPTPALGTARAMVFAAIIAVFFQMLPAFLWTWYNQLQDGTRLKWSMDVIFATEFARLVFGRFTETLTPEVFSMLLPLTLARLGLLGLLLLLLRPRITVAYYAGLALFTFEMIWPFLAFMQGWIGSATAAIAAVIAGLALFMLVSAASNFASKWERILVEADRRLKTASYWQLGNEFQRKGMWALAVAYYRAACGAAPNRPEFYKALGIGYNRLGRNDRAVLALEQALILDPSDPELPELIHQIQPQQARGAATQN
ncbi:MAG: hypothetical protein Kow0077_12330 [Anaerolineae bacterium]